MLFMIAEFILESGVWSVKQVFNLGYWMMYGTPETPEQKMLKELLEKQNEMLKQLTEKEGENNELKERLKAMEEEISKIVKDEFHEHTDVVSITLLENSGDGEDLPRSTLTQCEVGEEKNNV